MRNSAPPVTLCGINKLKEGKGVGTSWLREMEEYEKEVQFKR